MIQRPRILVIGHLGVMGRRYKAILNHLGCPWLGIDVDTPPTMRRALANSCQGILIATPTAAHVSNVVWALTLQKPILVEKPFSLDLAEVESICNLSDKCSAPLQMVNQYRFMGLSERDFGPTCFDYWSHGKDGLAMDCISILALATGPVELKEASPIWTCQVNGRRLEIQKMDQAYVAMVEDWIAKPRHDTDYIRSAHQKVSEYLCSKESSVPSACSLEYKPDQPQLDYRGREVL